MSDLEPIGVPPLSECLKELERLISLEEHRLILEAKSVSKTIDGGVYMELSGGQFIHWAGKDPIKVCAGGQELEVPPGYCGWWDGENLHLGITGPSETVNR